MSEFFTTLVQKYGKDAIIVTVTIAVFAAFVWGYFNLAHPTIVLTKPPGPVNRCPDLWIYDEEEGVSSIVSYKVQTVQSSIL